MKRGRRAGRHRKGSGYIRRRGRIYYFVYWVGGTRHEESSHSDKLEDAQQLLRTRLAAASVGPVRRDKEVLVKELLDDLERDYRVNHRRSVDTMLHAGLKWLRPYWGALAVSEVTTDRIQEYRLDREREHAAVATINNELALLRRAFKLARSATPPKTMLAPHFPIVKPNNARQGFLEPSGYKRLLEELPSYLKPVLVVGYHTGCRVGELLGRRGRRGGLKWIQVDLIQHEIVLWPGTTKNGEGRVLPIYGEMKPWLTMLRTEAQQSRPDCPWVFQRNGEPIRDFRGAWASATKRAGCEGLRFHDLRRSAVRNMMRAGFDRKRAMAISGHKTEATFERYNIVGGRDLREDLPKLEKYLERQLAEASAPITPAVVKPESVN